VYIEAVLKLLLIPSLLILASPLPAAEPAELKDAAGNVIIRYVVETPEGLAPAGTTNPARQVGLILCFPEHDRPVGDEILPVREALKRMGLSQQYVLLAGGPRERKFSAADHEPIQKLIEWAKKTYPVNPRRIYMYGKGEGGKISGQFAMLHPELVAASMTYSWGWWIMPSELKEAIDPATSPEFYMVLGLRDLSYHLTTVRDAYSRVSAKGYKVIYREFEDLGARTYHPPSNDDGIGWFTRLRNKSLPLSAQESELLFKAAKRATAPANGSYPEIALVGGAAAGKVLETLFGSKDPEVRAAAAVTAGMAIYSEATMQALAALTRDPSATVRRAAMRALALQANWRSAAAQHAFIALATGTQKAVDERDRVDAVDGIVHAARLQVRGVRQDPELFRALVMLLKDPNEELRTMASNTLAPIRDREFRGDLGRPERKEPAGGWAGWLNEITTKAAGYQKDYEVCGESVSKSEAMEAYCRGGSYLQSRKDPAKAFALTLRAAELNYVPAQAAAGMMFAIGKGVEQDWNQAAAWWTKAAEAGHILAATNLSMVYRGAPGVTSDAAKHTYWSKFVAERSKSID
jgi:TPR repeat protein